MYQFHFRIPPYYTLLVRSLSVLEVRSKASCKGQTQSALSRTQPPLWVWAACALTCLSYNSVRTNPACSPGTSTHMAPAPFLTPLPPQGIALASDPNYKVLGAAYPWIARRLLTDTTPELRR